MYNILFSIATSLSLNYSLIKIALPRQNEDWCGRSIWKFICLLQNSEIIMTKELQIKQ